MFKVKSSNEFKNILTKNNNVSQSFNLSVYILSNKFMKYLYKQTPNGYKNNAIIKNKPERV